MLNFTRRHLLHTSLLDFVYFCTVLPILAQRAVKANAGGQPRLSWDAFIDNLETAARHVRLTPPDEDQYVRHVAMHARALDPQDKFLVAARLGAREVPRFGPEYRDTLHTADVQVSLIIFEKGERIPHHDHPGMTGVMTCAAGSVEVKEYDVLGVPAATGWLLKTAGQQQLDPGYVSTLTSHSRNVHSVRASMFSQIVDIFTPPYNEERKAKTNWFEVEAFPVKGAADLYLAHPYHRR